MRRGRRILAAAGMMALLLSNIGAVTQAVFAQEQVTAAEPAETVEVTEPIEPATAAEDATDVQTATQDETPETAENDTVSVQDETSEIVEDDAVSGHDKTADDATTAIEGTDDSVAADDPTSETNNGMEGEDTKESAEGANTAATEETAAAEDADSEEAVEPAAEHATEAESEQTTTTADTTDPETGSEEAETVDTVDAEEDQEEESTETITLIKQTIRSKAEDGASVSISGNLPENAEAHMEPVTLNRDELDGYFGADVVDGMDRLAIYDISIYVNDEEWEPNDTVSVVVRNPDIKPVDETAEDADADAEDTEDAVTENIVVAHLEDGAEQIETTSSENSAEFEIKGTGEEIANQEDADQKEDEASTSETTEADDGIAEETTEVTAQVLESETEGDATTFETDGFSLYGFYTYTVDFYYEEAESRFPGGSEFLLSQVFEELGIDVDIADATDVTFTDDSLLGIEQEGDNWRLTSLLPFDTEEELTVMLEDGEVIRIVTKDAHSYPRYSVDNSDMKAFAGAIKNNKGSSYIGKYNIFGGGNGIAATRTHEAGFDGGTWGYNGSDTNDRLYSLKNYRVNEYGESSYNSSNSNYVSTSVGSIEWDGSLERAYFSFGYLSGFGSSSRKLVVEITGPKGGERTITICPNSTDRNDSREDEYVGIEDWAYLTFDATTFVNGEGTGLYTVKVTASGAMSNRRDNDDRLGDMGWTIYGVSYDKNQDYNVIIAGSVGEKNISSDSPATATFSQVITPSGAGKVWYNVQGGEKASGATDRDHLIVDCQDGNKISLGSGSGDGSVKVETDGTSWDTADIAGPNSFQTSPDTDANGKAYAKFSNRFSFAMGEFDSLSQVPVTGIEKTIDGGNDVFGSIMMMARIGSTGSNPVITKNLSIPYSDDVDTLKDSLAGNTALEFKIKIEPVSSTELESDGIAIPMPSGYDTTEYKGSGNYVYTVSISKNKIANEYEQTLIPDFVSALLDTNQSKTRTYKYKVTEVNSGLENWTYDSSEYYLEFTVEPYDSSKTVHTVSYKWIDKDGKELKKNSEGAYVSAGTFTNAYQAQHIVKTGVTAGAIPWAAGAAIIAMAAVGGATYRRARHRYNR